MQPKSSPSKPRARSCPKMQRRFSSPKKARKTFADYYNAEDTIFKDGLYTASDKDLQLALVHFQTAYRSLLKKMASEGKVNHKDTELSKLRRRYALVQEESDRRLRQ